MHRSRLELSDMVKGLSLLAMSNPTSPTLTEQNYQAYWIVLEDCDPRMFEAVIKDFMKNGFRFFPSAGEIYKAIERIKKAGEPTAEEAWESIRLKVVMNSQRRLPAKTEYVLRMVGGLERFAQADTNTALPHIKREFVKIYNEIDYIQEDRIALEGVDPKMIKSGAEMLGRPPTNAIEKFLCNLRVITNETVGQ